MAKAASDNSPTREWVLPSAFSMDATSTTDENAENVTNVQKDKPAAVATKNFKMAPGRPPWTSRTPRRRRSPMLVASPSCPLRPRSRSPPAPEEEGNTDCDGRHPMPGNSELWLLGWREGIRWA